jgi:hypothetical protein
MPCHVGVPRRLGEPPRPARSGRRQARSERERGGGGGERPARTGPKARGLELRRRGLVLTDRGLAKMPRPLVTVRDARQDGVDGTPGRTVGVTVDRRTEQRVTHLEALCIDRDHG